MKFRIVYTIIFSVILTAAAALGQTEMAFNITDLDIEELFIKEKIKSQFNPGDDPFLVIQDDTFFNIDRNVLSRLAGETLGDDLYREGELSEP